jgi:hypothetical protein
MATDPREQRATKGRKWIAEDRAEEVQLVAIPEMDHEKSRVWMCDSLSAFSRWVWWMAGALVGTGLLLALLRLVPASAGENRARSGLALLVAVAPAIVLYLLRPFFGARAVARENARVRGLPFAVHGYFDAIGSRTTEGEVLLTICFRGSETTESPNASFREPARRSSATAIDDGTLDALFRTVFAKLDAGGPPGTKRIVYSAHFETTESHNAHLAKWLRRAMRVLARVHHEHPISSVRVDGFR